MLKEYHNHNLVNYIFIKRKSLQIARERLLLRSGESDSEHFRAMIECPEIRDKTHSQVMTRQRKLKQTDKKPKTPEAGLKRFQTKV